MGECTSESNYIELHKIRNRSTGYTVYDIETIVRMFKNITDSENILLYLRKQTSNRSFNIHTKIIIDTVQDFILDGTVTGTLDYVLRQQEGKSTYGTNKVVIKGPTDNGESIVLCTSIERMLRVLGVNTVIGVLIFLQDL